MSATDEAVELGAQNMAKQVYVTDAHRYLVREALDGIPAHLLAQLAIERGGLETIGYMRMDDDRRVYVGSCPLPGDFWAYRIVPAEDTP